MFKEVFVDKHLSLMTMWILYTVSTDIKPLRNHTIIVVAHWLKFDLNFCFTSQHFSFI